MIKTKNFFKANGVSFHMIDEFTRLMTDKGFAAGTEEVRKVVKNNSSRFMPEEYQEMAMMIARINEKYLSQNNEDQKSFDILEVFFT